MIAAEEVTKTHLNDDDNLLDLTVTTPTGTKVIHTTDNHPFYDDTTDTWTPAGQLARGHHLRTTTGATVTVSAVAVRPGRGWMHNLTVERLHTYCVLAGTTPVLVHNDAGDDCNRAMNRALAWLDERGFVAERTTIGKFGTTAGQPIGMQTADGKTGFRVEFDERSGAHVNVWGGKEKGPHFNFDASESTVSTLQKNFGCE